MHAIIDSYFCDLRESGVGAEVNHTSIITTKEEDELWKKGVLGVDTPECLLRAIFYYKGSVFA